MRDLILTALFVSSAAFGATIVSASPVGAKDASKLLKKFSGVNESTLPANQCPPSSISSKCEAIRQYLKEGLEATEPFTNHLNANFNKSNASILFVGEGHSDFKVKENTKLLLTPILAEKGTCLMLELPPGLQSFLDKLNPTDDLKKVVKDAARKIAIEKTGSDTPYLEQERLVEEAAPQITVWMELALQAKKAGNRTFAIDMKPSSAIHGASSDEGLADRNQHMAKQLAAKLASGDCKKEVSINGVNHVVKSSADGKLKSLPILMKEKGIKNHLFVNVQNPYVIDIEPGCSIDDIQPVLNKGAFMFSKASASVSLFKALTGLDNSERATYLPVNSSEDITLGLLGTGYEP